mmetsp:Transcript_14041/g.45104  ORF Transcript_14041/g.45104 Transcript_14041/m.45104 type:complete len:363 (-) Transcript_14041:124-1212(-)
MYLLTLALTAAPPRPLLPTAHSGVFAGNFRTGTPAMMVHSVRNRQQPFSGWSRSTRQTSTSTTTSQFLEAQKPRSMAAAWIDGGVPRWVTLVDEVLFVVASAAFIKGSLDFFPGVPLQSYIEGINLFFAGSAVYTVLAVFAAYEIVEDAKLSGREPPPAKLVEQALYLLGSVFFLLGTAEFTPPAESSAEDAAVSVSVLGRTFFLGSAASIPEDTLAMGDELFILGSFLFSVAAFISAIDVSGESTGDEVSVLQRRTSVAVASLFELGGVAFIIGTPCFYPAGPMGMSACPEGTETLTRVGAALFVAGSVFYTIGSLIILAFEAWLTFFRGDEAGPDPGAAGGVGSRQGGGAGLQAGVPPTR